MTRPTARVALLQRLESGQCKASALSLCRASAAGWLSGRALDGLQPLVAEQPGLVELASQVRLPRPDSVVFAFIHPQRHQFQVGNHVVQLRADGAGDDVVHGKLVTLVDRKSTRLNSSHANIS